MREVEFHRSIEAVTAAEWNALGAAANPFTRHEFLLALEQTQLRRRATAAGSRAI